MTTSSTSLLGLALPVTGELNGTWGDVVNNSLTSLLDTAIAGTTTLSADLDVTLTTTALTANQARQAVLLCTGNRTSIKTITAPAQSKTYVVINATTGSPAYAVKIVGAGPTTGVTVAAGQAALVAWNGTDFTLIATTDASKLTGTLGVANGGTGQTTYTDGQLLIGNSTGNTLTKANLTAGTGITITNGSGSITVGGAAATTSDIGMVKLGDAAAQTVAANAVTATASRTYALQLNASGQAVVNVPWTDTTGSPAGSNTEIQFNNAGVFGASANLTFAADTLSVNGVSLGRGGGSFATSVAIGADSLSSNVNGADNVAIGYWTLKENITGGSVTAVGSFAMLNMRGSMNTAVGYLAMRGSFTPANNTGSSNTAVGFYSMLPLTSGEWNSSFGNYSGAALETGQYNTLIGARSGYGLTTTSFNTFVGHEAGFYSTGSKNTILGRFNGNQGGLNLTTASNYIVLSDGDGNPRWYVDNTGTAGYAPSTGALVTQGTSRTTPVTINTPTGRITLVSAAGTTAWQSFTVNNSSVTSLDTVRVVQRSGTDLYQIFVTNVSAGSFRITFATTGGTTTEQPTFNFAVLKGQVS